MWRLWKRWWMSLLWTSKSIYLNLHVPWDRMCLLRLLLFWKTLLQREQRYTLLCSLALCLFRTAPLSGVLCRLLLSAAAAASEATGSELPAGGFASAHIRNPKSKRNLQRTQHRVVIRVQLILDFWVRIWIMMRFIQIYIHTYGQIFSFLLEILYFQEIIFYSWSMNCIL